jgi:hypothetical protein
MRRVRLVTRGDGSVVVDGDGVPPAALGGGQTGYFTELDARGRIRWQYTQPGGTAWQQPGTTSAVRVRFDRDLPDPAARLVVDWFDLDTGAAIVPSIDTTAHFGTVGGPCGSLSISSNAAAYVSPDDSVECDGTNALHVLRRDGSEPLGAAGIQIASVLGNDASGYAPGLPLRVAITLANDGSIWVVTERAGTGSDVRVGLRAARYETNGSLAALSDVLVDPTLVPRTTDALGRDVPDSVGIWTATDTDGGLLFHLGGHHPTDSQLASHFARVAFDGSVSWRWTGPPGLVAFSDHFDTPIALDGHHGIFAALGSSPRMSLTVVHVDASGSAGPLGGPDFVSPVGFIHPGVAEEITAAAISPDGSGGFILLASPLIPMLMRFDAAHTRLWPTDLEDITMDPTLSFEIDPRVGLSWIQMENDERGGVWIAQNQGDSFTSFVQHVDGAGWALFWAEDVRCEPRAGVGLLIRPSSAESGYGFYESPWPREADSDGGVLFDGGAADGGLDGDGATIDAQ